MTPDEFAEFSPPYGDGTGIYKTFTHVDVFSPPYGDGTSMRELVARTGLFSPPYGDGTRKSIMDRLDE